MKKWALGLVMVAACMAPAMALGGPGYPNENPEIRINGVPFYGNWAFIGDRVYVNVDAFTNAIGYPHQHNYLNWQLSEKPGKGNPCLLSVDSNNKKLATVRHAGTTMVDLRQACDVLKIPYHYDFANQIFDVGTPFVNEYIIGSFFRRYQNHGGYVQGTTCGPSNYNDGLSWAHHKWHHHYGHDIDHRHDQGPIDREPWGP